MQSFALNRAEEILQNLVHDLRQPLGNIDISAYILNLSLPDADPQIRAHIQTIGRQVEQACDVLRSAVAEMGRLRDQDAMGENRELTKSATAGVR